MHGYAGQDWRARRRIPPQLYPLPSDEGPCLYLLKRWCESASSKAEWTYRDNSVFGGD